MKKIITTAVILLLLQPADAQSFNYFNKFQDFAHKDKNADSAVYCLKMMASNEGIAKTSLRMLVHDVFAQFFKQPQADDRTFAKSILVNAYNDTSKVLSNMLRPVYYLVQAQDAGKDAAELSRIVNGFMRTELADDKFYAQKTARYGLMLHQLIEGIPSLARQDNQLFESITKQLGDEPLQVQGTSTSAELDRRAWARYLLASINYMRSLHAEGEEQMSFLKAAYDFSPDLVDRNRKSAYFYDQYFLFPQGKESFKDDYLAKLVNSSGDKAKIQATLLSMALIDPVYKKNLEDYYRSATDSDFNKYWCEAVDGFAAADAPAIDLEKMNKERFTSRRLGLADKWILIDFWGTWCRPCREEHPMLQRFYDSTVKKNSQLSLLTIACQDERTTVEKYMREKKFSFPVAMSDNKIEYLYKVQGYPTKILITPKGRYVTVPFGVDWAQFVKAYASL